jgi:hypothetical protein
MVNMNDGVDQINTGLLSFYRERGEGLESGELERRGLFFGEDLERHNIDSDFTTLFPSLALNLSLVQFL